MPAAPPMPGLLKLPIRLVGNEGPLVACRERTGLGPVRALPPATQQLSVTAGAYPSRHPWQACNARLVPSAVHRSHCKRPVTDQLTRSISGERLKACLQLRKWDLSLSTIS